MMISQAELTMSRDESLKPRKRPSQQRSKILVASVIEACHKILETESPDKLTSAHLAEVAGVVEGSLYRYYPNLNAIVAEVFHDKWSEECDVLRREYLATKKISLEIAIRSFLDIGVAYRRRMLAFHRDFYQEYHSHFALRKDFQIAETLVYDLLQFYQEARGIDEPEMRAFLLTEALYQMYQKSVGKHPEYFDNPSYIELLFDMSMAMIKPQLNGSHGSADSTAEVMDEQQS